MSEGPPISEPAVPAGWYPHPTAPGWEAFWTGSGWGTETRQAGAAAPEQQIATPEAEARTDASPAGLEQGAVATEQVEATDRQEAPAQEAAAGSPVVADLPADAAPAAVATAAPAAAVAPAVTAGADRERSSALPMLLCVLGGLVAVAGAFLPAAKLEFGGTEIDLVDNTMIAAGYGIAVVAAAVLGAGIAIWAHLRRAASWLPILLGFVILAIAVYAGTAGLDVTPDLGTLGSEGAPALDDAGDPSTGIFAAAIGGLLMILGGLPLARSRG